MEICLQIIDSRSKLLRLRDYIFIVGIKFYSTIYFYVALLPNSSSIIGGKSRGSDESNEPHAKFPYFSRM